MHMPSQLAIALMSQPSCSVIPHPRVLFCEVFCNARAPCLHPARSSSQTRHSGHRTHSFLFSMLRRVHSFQRAFATSVQRSWAAGAVLRKASGAWPATHAEAPCVTSKVQEDGAASGQHSLAQVRLRVCALCPH